MNSKEESNSKITVFLKNLPVLGPHTCPWWLGYTFDDPLRRFIHLPESILSEFVSPGDTAVDIGCGLGCFSIALAELVKSIGRVVAFDVQAQMVERAQQPAECRNLGNRINFRGCAPYHISFEGEADFALACWMLQEVSDPERLFAEVRSFLRPSSQLTIAEPRLHVSETRFSATVELAKRN